MKGINLHMKDCNYPNCFECDRPDCDMEKKDINALLKHRQAERITTQKIREIQERKQRMSTLPHCDKCELCTKVLTERGDDYVRVCTVDLRLVEKKIRNSPIWCVRRSLNGI